MKRITFLSILVASIAVPLRAGTVPPGKATAFSSQPPMTSGFVSGPHFTNREDAFVPHPPADSLDGLLSQNRRPAPRAGRPMPDHHPMFVPGGPGSPGALLQRLQKLPPEEREQVLRNNQRFQELPKERQEQLLNRLRRFESMSPEQREMIEQRFNAFSKLTPEQRQKAREIYLQRWRALPEDRHRVLTQEFRKLREMTPDQRGKYLDSPEVATRFSSEERGLLKDLAGLSAPTPPRPGGPDAAGRIPDALPEARQ